MARASVRTLLPLDSFAKIVGMHPLHFNQVVVADIAAAKVCGMPVLQYSWQDADRVGREEIADAIALAEENISRELGFRPAPDWEADDRVQVQRPSAPELFNAPVLNARGQRMSVLASHGYAITGGIEAKTLILNRPVVYSDGDGDGYSETATITCATTVTDPEEISIYFPGESAADQWEIRPIKVSIAAGTATITCRREQLVLGDLTEELAPEAVDGLDNANFLTTVDVYRHYNDPSQQVQFLWEAVPNTCGCGSTECTNCAMSTQWGCLNIRDYRLGIIAFAPADWDSTTLAYTDASWAISRAPDRARLWYRAGWKDTRSARPLWDMDRRWARAVAGYALSFLDRPLCECNSLESVTKYWREDLGQNLPDSSFNLSEDILNNPFGTSRGGIEAWKLVRRERLGINL